MADDAHGVDQFVTQHRMGRNRSMALHPNEDICWKRSFAFAEGFQRRSLIFPTKVGSVLLPIHYHPEPGFKQSHSYHRVPKGLDVARYRHEHRFQRACKAQPINKYSLRRPTAHKSGPAGPLNCPFDVAGVAKHLLIAVRVVVSDSSIALATGVGRPFSWRQPGHG